MRPFCLGHHLLLSRLNMPYADCPDANCGHDEIVIGIVLCSMTYDDGLEALVKGRLPKLIRKWRRRMGGWWINGKPTIWDIEARFRDYLRDGYKLAPVWRHGGVGIAMSAPWEIMLKTRLVMAGYSEADVINGYLPGRWYDYFGAIEWHNVHTLEDRKQWKRVFFTRVDAERMTPDV